MADPSSSSFQRSYDVFLSFRGQDTRNSFTAYLYEELRTKGINTFIDDEKLERGDVISSTLVAAIENSKFSVIVLSENYANSRWCLEELVKILECMRTRGQRVHPIFYKVNPSHVRYQKGKFGQAFATHEEKKRNMERVPIWRDALTQVAYLSGWDSRDQHEPMLIKEIATYIWNELLSRSSNYAENLVGIESSIQEIKSLLFTESLDVRMVGIWGMGGIGKTTLAKSVYDQISHQFEACCFLEDVSDYLEKRGFPSLQEKFLSQLLGNKNLNRRRNISMLYSKRVLIVVDDVNNSKILEVLIGKHDWFGCGSRIIITTRDKFLLVRHGVDILYEVGKLNDDNALQLFSRFAFGNFHPIDDYVELSQCMMLYAQGLPLALEVLGSFLFGKSKHEWESQLARLKKFPNEVIQNVLQGSFDRLDAIEREIFLDIACFFQGHDKDYVMEILRSCGFFPEIGIRSLIEKSLIFVVENKLMMHNLLQRMGWEIVRQASPEEPGTRSRLWIHDDVNHVLKKNTGTEEVQGISIDLSSLEEINFTNETFARMNRLRLLRVYKSNSLMDFKREKCKVHFCRGFKFHCKELRYLYWYEYPLKSLPNDFNLKNLVDLNMPYSQIKQLWKGTKVLENLKFMNLKNSKFLTETPDFSRVTNLEELVLKGCISLYKVHPSLGDLNKLNFLSLKNCKMLKSLPSSICGLKCLEILILSGCSKFEELPENFGNLEMLKEFCADRTAITVLPSSFPLLRNLEILSFEGCKGPPPAFSWLLPRRSSNFSSPVLSPLSSFSSLKTLSLRACNISDGVTLDSLGFLSSLEDLDLSENNFVALPSNISRLSHLKMLGLENCKRLQALPELPTSICSIMACNCTSLETISNQSFGSLLMTVRLKEHIDCRINQDGLLVPALSAVVFGSRIPDWIRYQSSGSEVKAELPPNWFNSNFLGLALCVVTVPKLGLVSLAHFFDLFWRSCTLFCSTSNCASSSFDVYTYPNHLKGKVESDHLWLVYVPLPRFINWNQFTHIMASFRITTFMRLNAIKECGIGLVYVNEEVNYSIFSPPNESSVVLQEIHEGPSGSRYSNIDGSESENSDYYSADEGEPITPLL
ncbi:hypothetical protein PVL29_024930 [Vitis rotundifolia]|uniref:ADP-ribosyl cyclase/cyclic ADP-ribose hydrolase n=1 Tax=Vitis rotundifolia TaxID=103349 RepID=A0AA39DBH3_VITRO|nr:hypothetical protein PVL29_024930 [Vitis rotundifolia]